MECPRCKNTFKYGIKLHNKTVFGKFYCPFCQVRLSLATKRADRLFIMFNAAILLLVVFLPTIEAQIYGVLSWLLIAFIWFPVELYQYRKTPPRLVNDKPNL